MYHSGFCGSKYVYLGFGYDVDDFDEKVGDHASLYHLLQRHQIHHPSDANGADGHHDYRVLVSLVCLKNASCILGAYVGRLHRYCQAVAASDHAHDNFQPGHYDHVSFLVSLW